MCAHTQEGFLRNNRGINDGADLPEEFMTALYDRIAGSEIKMKDDGGLLSECAAVAEGCLARACRRCWVCGVRCRPQGFALGLSSHDLRASMQPPTTTALDPAGGSSQGKNILTTLFALMGAVKQVGPGQ